MMKKAVKKASPKKAVKKATPKKAAKKATPKRAAKKASPKKAAKKATPKRTAIIIYKKLLILPNKGVKKAPGGDSGPKNPSKKQ